MIPGVPACRRTSKPCSPRVARARPVTALTVQDTVNVSDFRVLDRDWVLAQARAIIADLPVAAVKLGMLGSVQMVDTVVEIMQALPAYRWSATRCCAPAAAARWAGRRRLRHARAPAADRRRWPRRTCRRRASSPSCPRARQTNAREALGLLPEHLLITGGHGDEAEIHNRLYCAAATATPSPAPACRAATTAPAAPWPAPWPGALALGEEVVSAVRSALDYTWRTLRDAEQPGHGQFVPRRLPLDFCS